MKKLLKFTILTFLMATMAFAQTRWTPDMMIKFKRVGGTAISPDGKWIAYTVGTPIMEGEKSESADLSTTMSQSRRQRLCKTSH